MLNSIFATDEPEYSLMTYPLPDFFYLPFWVKITRIRYEDRDLDKATRFLGLPVFPCEGVALADRPSAGRLSGKLIHRSYRLLRLR